MTASSWGVASLICLHLSSLGALPPEVRQGDVTSYLNGSRPVRVLIADNASSLRLRPQTQLAIEDGATGERIAVANAGAGLTLRAGRGTLALTGSGTNIRRQHLRFRPIPTESGSAISSSGGWGRSGVYPGPLDLRLTATGIQAVESVSLETYVAGVVASEMPASFPLEAMKAQAIAARTYALYHLGGHESDNADLCGSVHCQAYAGRPSPNSRAARAARETKGRVLVWGDLLIDAMYSSACGGSTATAWEVRQGQILPYLQARSDAPSPNSDPYCSRDHKIQWTRTFTFTELNRLVSANLDDVVHRPGLCPGRLETLQLAKPTPFDRAEWLKVYTDTGAYRVRGDAIRWLFGIGRPGPGGLRSIAFDMHVERDASGQPTSFTFTGVGHGHGIGLCQWGARGRALAGQTAPQILAAYYPGTRLVDLSH